MQRVTWLAVLLLPLAAPCQDDTSSPWVQDYELARSLARDRNKDLLMVFLRTAVDGPDARLEQEVLSKPEFLDRAAGLFVLARFDYPEDPEQSTEVLQRQNAWLLEKYPAARLPVIWLADEMGRPYARCGYLPVGAEAYVAMLDGKRQAHLQAVAALQEATGSGGIERAQALAEALRLLDDHIVATTYYREMLEIIELDEGGKAGLKPEFEAIARDAAARPFLVRMQEEMGQLVAREKWSELDVEIEKAREKHDGERWAEQYLTFLQGIRKWKGDQDCAAALPLFTAALAMAPRSELAPEIDCYRQEAAAALAKRKDGGAGKG